LTTLRVGSRQFSDTATAFNVPHLHLAPPLGVIQFEFCQISGISKPEYLGYRAARTRASWRRAGKN